MHEGRPLPRPDEELVDQGLAFDLATLLDRRRMLRAAGLGAATLGLAACGDGTDNTAATPSASASASTGEIPQETAGPYPGDGSNGPNVLTRSGIVRSDIRSGFGTASGTAAGVPMTLDLTIQDLSNGGKPFTGVAVYVWQCDREGRYSMYSAGITGENYLRGVQLADATGRVRFTSIFPACYSGRWPHIHFEVYPDRASITDADRALATSQVALPEAVCRQVYAQAGYAASVTNLSRVTLTDDNVFGDDGGTSQLGTVTGDVTRGYTVSLLVRVDPTTTPAGGGNAPPGGPGGAPPSGAPGGPPPGGTPPGGAPGAPPPPGGTPPGGSG
ncbi:intradiol ring-cleavage dioxygenase [Pilimelia anulata]|nr:intradiol ring-cleavage dioxygenase [Pilimelia anulata]